MTFIILFYFLLSLLICILIWYTSLPFTSLFLLIILICIDIILDFLIMARRGCNYFKRYFLSVILIVFLFIIFIKSIAKFLFWRLFKILNLIDPNDNICLIIIIRIDYIFINGWISCILFIIGLRLEIGSWVSLSICKANHILLQFSLFLG